MSKNVRLVVVKAGEETKVPLLLGVLRACQEAKLEFYLASPSPITPPGITVRAVTGGDGGVGPLNLLPNAARTGPRSSFFGAAGRAHHVVYVIDRSGSMLDTLDQVKRELLRSISRLEDTQTFHVIFFGRGPPQEGPPSQHLLRQPVGHHLSRVQQDGAICQPRHLAGRGLHDDDRRPTLSVEPGQGVHHRLGAAHVQA